MKVCLLFRHREKNFFSIEKLFNCISKYFFYVQAEKVYLPYDKSRKINYLLNLLRVGTLVKSCDLVHITGDVYYIAMALRKKRILLTYHDLVSLFYNRKSLTKRVLELFWVKLPVRLAERIVVISEQTKKELLNYVSEDKIEVIPDCIDDSWFESKKVFPNKIKDFTIIAFGRKPNKNLTKVIQAVGLLDLKLIIIGSITIEQKFLLDSLSLRYEQYDYVSDKQLQQLYLKSDLLVFPSLYEGFGMPIIEAQALGIPVVTSNLEPMKSTVGEGGVLVDPTDVKSIKNAIEKFFNLDFWLKYSYLARKNAEKYRCSEIAKKYESIYLKLINY